MNPENLKRHNRELAILNAIAAALNHEVDLGPALEVALSQVAELLELRTGWVWLLHEDGRPYLAAALNLPPALREQPHLMEGSCYCLDTFHSGDLDGAANVNVVGCSRLSGLVDGTDGLRYHASVPLYAPQGKKLGVLNVADTDWRQLSSDELQLLGTIADLISIAVERARLFSRSARIGAMEERNRLAREIHDTLAQRLAAITLQMETADALFEADADPADIWAVVRKTLALSRSGLEEARRSVLDLRAAPLEGRTLADALRTLGDGMDITFDFAGEGQPLPLRLETALYRITQEALTNVARHAGTDRAEVALVITPQQLTLSVTDDGRGFRPDRIPEGRYGLIGINERVHLLGGSFDVQSCPGHGTHLSIRIPLEEAQ